MCAPLCVSTIISKEQQLAHDVILSLICRLVYCVLTTIFAKWTVWLADIFFLNWKIRRSKKAMAEVNEQLFLKHWIRVAKHQQRTKSIFVKNGQVMAEYQEHELIHLLNLCFHIHLYFVNDFSLFWSIGVFRMSTWWTQKMRLFSFWLLWLEIGA